MGTSEVYIAYGHTRGKDCVSPSSRFHPTDNKMAPKRNVMPTSYSLTFWSGMKCNYHAFKTVNIVSYRDPTVEGLGTGL